MTLIFPCSSPFCSSPDKRLWSCFPIAVFLSMWAYRLNPYCLLCYLHDSLRIPRPVLLLYSSLLFWLLIKHGCSGKSLRICFIISKGGLINVFILSALYTPGSYKICFFTGYEIDTAYYCLGLFLFYVKELLMVRFHMGDVPAVVNG